MTGVSPVPDEAESFASRTSSREWPPEVHAVMDGIAARMAWPSMHWGIEDVHQDAWPHIAAAALDAAAALPALREGIAAEVLGPVREREPGRDAVNAMARVLIDEWERAERKPVGVSYIATFADMARAALTALPAPVQAAEPVEVATDGDCPTCGHWVGAHSGGRGCRTLSCNCPNLLVVQAAEEVAGDGGN